MSEPTSEPGAAWIDAHCHLQLAGGDEHVTRARAAGVVTMVCVGTDAATSAEAIGFASRHPDVFATVGLHPHDADRVDAEWAELERLANDPRCVGIGETGFDLHYRNSSIAGQEDAFRRQIGLAIGLGKALVIHSRDAWADTFRVLDDEGIPERTVFHCFTGGPDEARAALERGCLLSFSGIVSFKNAADVRAAAALTPADRLLVETDSPYLAPEPHRGRENEPAFVGAVGAALAAARGEPVGTVAARTRTNAERVFGVRT
ncbi:MAG: TatD family hydrolase [Actinomycetota bacterium]